MCLSKNNMKVLARAVISLSIGSAASFILAVVFFRASDYTMWIDRFFLIAVPAIAIGISIFQALPTFLGWFARIQKTGIVPQYLIGFFISAILTSSAVGFFSGPLRTPFGMALFTAGCILPSSLTGYFLIRRVKRSIRSGFLSSPINSISALSLPVFLTALIIAALGFPSLFSMEYLVVPAEWLALFLLVSTAAGLGGLALLEKMTAGGYTQRVKETKLYPFLSHNLPGFYSGAMFFLINLIIARALNHPALGINSVLFEADAGPWMTILASPEGDVINRSVHPLTLILIRPIVRLAAGMMGDYWQLGGIIVSAAAAGTCVFLTWVFVLRAVKIKSYAFLVSILFGASATQLVFGSLTENYIFGTAALITFFLLIQAGEKRFSILVPSGLLLFGITITNLAQGVIGLFFHNFGWRKLIQYTALVLSIGILLTTAVNAMYPGIQTFFFVPSDLSFEFNFVKTSQNTPSTQFPQKLQVVARTMFLYNAVGPSPIKAVSKKPPFPTIDIKTFDVRENRLASYRGAANIPLALWLVLLAGSLIEFIRTMRSSRHTSLMYSLLGVLAFNFILHLFYGTELFLYSPYWMYALIFFIALALSEFSHKIEIQIFLMITVFSLMVNNLWFMFTIWQGLAPFYAAVP